MLEHGAFHSLDLAMMSTTRRIDVAEERDRSPPSHSEITFTGKAAHAAATLNTVEMLLIALRCRPGVALRLLPRQQLPATVFGCTACDNQQGGAPAQRDTPSARARMYVRARRIPGRAH